MNGSGLLRDILATLFDRRAQIPVVSGSEPIRELCHALLSEKGEVSGMRLAREIIARYRESDDDGRLAYFQLLADEMDIDPDAVAKAAADYGKSRGGRELIRLARASEPPRQEFLRRLNQAPGATAELVAMRVDLQRFIGSSPDLDRVDVDFQHLFGSWFNRGFLVLRSIQWSSPASILEKIIQYEAVHAIDSWDELRQRLLPPDRRCFGFFHPSMPDEPLIFVEVALVSGVPASIQKLLTDKREVLDPLQADTAVFYSISNCQEGLRGISFGNSLIKQVVDELNQEFPHLTEFVTLSPIPGLVPWLRGTISQVDDAAALLLDAAAGRVPVEGLDPTTIRQVTARYLLEEKRSDGMPLDPVARFHLGNGAEVLDIHADADTSGKGLRESCGAMVNYRYSLHSIEQNHESYVRERKIAASSGLEALLRKPKPAPIASRTTEATP